LTHIVILLYRIINTEITAPSIARADQSRKTMHTQNTCTCNTLDNSVKYHMKLLTTRKWRINQITLDVLTDTVLQ